MGLLDNVTEDLYPALEQFFENFSDDLEALSRYQNEKNREEVRKISLGIEQSASVFELNGLAQTARELAESTRTEDWEVIEEKIQLVSDTLRAAHREFQREYQ